MPRTPNGKRPGLVPEPQTPKLQSGLSSELRKVINERNVLTAKSKKKMLEALKAIGDDEIVAMSGEHKERAIQEFLSSEVCYLHRLELVMRYFMEPIKERDILSASDYATLFGNIETIYRVNEGLLNELKSNTTDVAAAFSKIAPFFKMYSLYACNYEKCLKALQKLQVENYDFNKFLDMQESRPEVQSKLSALLIAPIQRLPRYRLLLMQVLDYTQTKDDDYKVLRDCLTKIESVIQHINQSLVEQENSQRLLELQRCLTCNKPAIIKPGRKIIKEGVLTKMCTKGNYSYKRYFVLTNDIFLCCKMGSQNPKAINSLKCLNLFPVGKCSITEVLDKGCIKISCQNEELVLYDSSLDVIRSWAETLKDTFGTYLENKKSLRKDSTMRRPVKRKDLDEYSDYGISPGIKRNKRASSQGYVGYDLFKITSNGSIAENEKQNFVRGIQPRTAFSGRSASENRFFQTKDSLYPLREHLQEQFANGTGEILQNGTNTNKELFVFGSHNQPTRGFNFKICDYFSSVTSCFKKVLGFK